MIFYIDKNTTKNLLGGVPVFSVEDAEKNAIFPSFNETFVIRSIPWD